MKKILAVSGGVDSMVMLEIMASKFPAEELVVATFDHGMRESSFDDAKLVAKKANELGIKFYSEKAKLSPNASEEQAREKRYEFLRKIARREDGEIFTAHHLDDLVETVAINCIRGTGPRGLAVLNSLGIIRPFIDGFFGKVFDKKEILKYASEHEITYRQDPTNTSEKYLRNRVRPLVAEMSSDEKQKVYDLWKKQKDIYEEIDRIVKKMIPKGLKFDRAAFSEIDDNLALEILRAALLKIGVSATRPQSLDFLNAIRTYQTGKYFNLPNDKLVRINRKDFQLEV